MCIRDDWRVDNRPPAPKLVRVRKLMLDAECFTQKTFPFCNLIHSVGKVLQNRFSVSGVPCQKYSTNILERRGGFLQPLKRLVSTANFL